MLSIAALCRIKGWPFEYLSKTVPDALKQKPDGNYRLALELGMQLHEVAQKDYETAIAQLKNRNVSSGTFVIPQGGAASSAAEGIAGLAEEIRDWKKAARVHSLTVATPSGTGTTAAYLARALPECKIVTAPAVGTGAYLKRQIEMLLPQPQNLEIIESEKRFRFGFLYPELFELYQALKTAGIEFDLLYAPVMWTALLEKRDRIEGEVLYVHSGGVSGNETMLARYARQRSVALKGIQV